MSDTSYTFTLYLSVHDETALRKAAETRALDDGMTPEEAAEYLDEAKQSITDCIVMLFDPGESPDGCQIEQSSAE